MHVELSCAQESLGPCETHVQIQRVQVDLSPWWPMSPQLGRHLCLLTITCDPWNDIRRGSVKARAHLFKKLKSIG